MSVGDENGTELQKKTAFPMGNNNVYNGISRVRLRGIGVWGRVLLSSTPSSVYKVTVATINDFLRIPKSHLLWTKPRELSQASRTESVREGVPGIRINQSKSQEGATA